MVGTVVARRARLVSIMIRVSDSARRSASSGPARVAVGALMFALRKVGIGSESVGGLVAGDG